MSLSTYASLSYLHESSSNLSLHTIYIKRKEKPKLQEMKTRLNPISAWSSHFQCKYWLFIGITHTRRIPGRSGEQTLPLTPQPSRVFAARVWPGGHTLLVGRPGIPFCFYLQLVSSFESSIVTKWPLILGFNRSILRGFFSTGFQPLDFALIQ